jgi:hypothetical protein
VNRNTQDDYPAGARPYPGDRHLGSGKNTSFPTPDVAPLERRATGTKQKSIAQPTASFSRKKSKFAR